MLPTQRTWGNCTIRSVPADGKLEQASQVGRAFSVWMTFKRGR